MSRLPDYDLTKDSIQVQEFSDDVRRIINNGLYEVQVTATSSPNFDAPNEPVIVLSIFGAQYRLYVSYLGQWYYVNLTALP